MFLGCLKGQTVSIIAGPFPQNCNLQKWPEKCKYHTGNCQVEVKRNSDAIDVIKLEDL